MELVAGPFVEVWADGFSEAHGEYVFSNLVRLPVPDQDHADVTARTTTDPERVGVAVARIAVGSVTDPLRLEAASLCELRMPCSRRTGDEGVMSVLRTEVARWTHPLS